jgi:hypothetical protein
MNKARKNGKIMASETISLTEISSFDASPIMHQCNEGVTKENCEEIGNGVMECGEGVQGKQWFLQFPCNGPAVTSYLPTELAEN